MQQGQIGREWISLGVIRRGCNLPMRSMRRRLPCKVAETMVAYQLHHFFRPLRSHRSCRGRRFRQTHVVSGVRTAMANDRQSFRGGVRGLRWWKMVNAEGARSSRTPEPRYAHPECPNAHMISGTSARDDGQEQATVQVPWMEISVRWEVKARLLTAHRPGRHWSARTTSDRILARSPLPVCPSPAPVQ